MGSNLVADIKHRGEVRLTSRFTALVAHGKAKGGVSGAVRRIPLWSDKLRWPPPLLRPRDSKSLAYKQGLALYVGVIV